MSDEPEQDPWRDLTREEVEPYAAGSPAVAAMLRHGLPLNRATYLARAWAGAPPSRWTGEHESMVPECFRDPDAVKHDDDNEPDD